VVIQSNNRRFYNHFFLWAFEYFFKVFWAFNGFFVLILWDWPICFAYFKGLMPKYFKKDIGKKHTLNKA
jgi:hypothetical protein